MSHSSAIGWKPPADLVHWVALTNVVSSNGVMAIIDVDAALYPKRFYRAGLSLPPASINSPQRSPRGLFQFNFAGELARRYEVQASTDLVNWVSITNVLLTTSPTTFIDPAHDPLFPPLLSGAATAVIARLLFRRS